jgi:hypothetical protein
MSSVVHSGTLYKLGGGSLQVWQPRYFEVVGRELRYYDSAKADTGAFKGSIPLEHASIHDRGSAGSSKPCFSISSGAVAKKGGKEYFLHAVDAASKYEWIAALMVATGNPQYEYLSQSGDDDERQATLARIANCPLAVAGELKVNGNDTCADCGASLPTWAVVSDDTGVLVCIECIGVHRQLWSGKCKEVQLDRWENAAVDVIRSRGNRTVNEELEFLVGFDTPKPLPTSTRDVRESFIRAKYEGRRFTRAATGARARREPIRDVGQASARSVSLSIPPRYIGVVFIVLQQVVAGSKQTKLPCVDGSVAVVANGFQHVLSKRAEKKSDERGEVLHWNEAMQIGVTHLSTPITISILDAPDAPQQASATFTVVASKHDASEEPRPITITGEDRLRGRITLHALISFAGLT